MKRVRIRKLVRGDEKVLVIPKALAEKVQSKYMSVELDASGRLTYTPTQ
jgi:hypothetical protein